MKRNITAFVLAFVLASSAAYAALQPGELKRLLTTGTYNILASTITTLTATSATITTLVNTTLTNSGLLTENRAPSADSATTNNAIDVNLTSPVDTTGTNTHNGVNVDLTVSNATGGTNSLRAFNLGNVTGDAQVDVTGLNIGTGTRLGTSRAIVVSTGWDTGLDITNTSAADSAATDIGIDLNLTTPVDTTGTNTHYGLNIDTTIGNASGGTNIATAINIANVTGDAQVTENGLVIGTGFDVGADFNSTANFDAAVTMTGDLSGDGGDQLYGFLQDQVASTTVGITAGQCGKTFVSNSADVMTLPEASTVLGCRLTFVCGTVDDFDINPADGTDAISTVASITGTNTTTVLAPSAGDAIRCTDIGSSIVIEAIGADLWASIGTANGIWTDVN